MYVVTLWSYL